MYGLTKVTLHNSYYANLTVSVRTIGHTNCSGTNAAGKTSMLQLIPLFYGCPPRLLNPKNSDKLPFLDFVLPAQSSLLIYDYQRHDGACCAVVYRSPNSGIAYRFIKGTSESTFFRDDIRAHLQSGETAQSIFALLTSSGVGISNQLTTIADYAAVIQNDTTSLRRSTSGGRALFRDAQRFSLGSQSSSMRLMGEMTYTLLKRTKMFERLKQMITETQFAYSPTKVPQHRNNEKLSADLKGLRDFNQHKVELKECVRLHHERLSIEVDVFRYARGVKNELANLNTHIDDINGAIEKTELNKARLSNEFDEQKSAIHIGQLVHAQLVTSLTDEISKAESEYEHWISLDIPVKEMDFANIQSFRDKARDANNHYIALYEEHNDIISTRDRQLNDIQRRYLSCVDEHQRQKKILDHQLDALEQAYRSTATKIESQRKQDIDAQSVSYNKEKDVLIVAKAKTEQQIESASFTKEEISEQDIANDSIQQIDRKITQLEDEKQDFTSKESAAEKTYKAQIERIEKKQAQIDELHKKRAHLNKLCYPVDGSLLSEFKNNFPQWTSSIGKIINPELLQRTNLEPKFLTNHQTIFGVSLNLDNIESPEHCTKQEILLEQLERENTTLRIEEDAYQGMVDNAKIAKDSWSVCITNRESTENLLKLQRKFREEAVNYLANLKDKHKQQLFERTSRLKKLAKEQDDEIFALREKSESILTAINAHFDLELRRSHDEKLINSSAIMAKIERAKELIDNDLKISKEQIADINLVYSQQCKALSIDESTLSSAKAQSEKALDDLKMVESFGDILQEHKLWSESIWQKIPEKSSSLAEKQRHLTQLTIDLNDLEQHHRKTIKAIAEQLAADHRALRDKKALAQKASEILSRVGPATEGAAEVGDLDYLCQQLSALIASQRDLKNKVLESVHKVTHILEGNAGSKITEAWGILLQSRKNKSSYPEHSHEFQIQLPEDLDTLLEKHVPQINDSLIETVKAVGSQFIEFYKSLQQLDLEVGQVSRTLKEKINTDQRIASLKDIHLELTSKIHTAIEGWDDIQAFVREWQEWDVVFSHKLPPETLELSLSRVISLFQHANIQTDINSLVDLKITMIESGRPAVIDSNASFDDSSSNGLSYLALIIIFVGMSRYLCPNIETTLTWPIDELATLDPHNVSSLFAMLDRNSIQVFSAFPSTDFNLLQHFKNRYVLYRDKGAREFLDSPDLENAEISAIAGLLNTEEEVS